MTFSDELQRILAALVERESDLAGQLQAVRRRKGHVQLLIAKLVRLTPEEEEAFGNLPDLLKGGR